MASLRDSTPWIENQLEPLFPGRKLALAARAASDEADSALLERLSREQTLNYAGLRIPERRREWAEARRGELEIRARLVSAGVAPDRIAYSVSHSADEVVVLGVERGDGLERVGIDLEPEGREIEPRIRERLCGGGPCPPCQEELERVSSLSTLELWVIKEACFKADPANCGTWITQYRILGWDPVNRRGRAAPPRGDHAIDFLLLGVAGWQLAVARY